MIALREIVLDCIGSNCARGHDYSTKNDLYEYAESIGYRGSIIDLFNTATALNLFEDIDEDIERR